MINGVPDSMQTELSAAVSAALAGRDGSDSLSVVLTRLLNGEWIVFIVDGANLEVVHQRLSAQIVRAVKQTELRLSQGLSAEDRRVLEIIAGAHGHGPRRPVALMDIAWAETGSEDAARQALQRLVLLGLVKMTGGASHDAVGSLTDKAAELIGTGSRMGTGGGERI